MRTLPLVAAATVVAALAGPSSSASAADLPDGGLPAAPGTTSRPVLLPAEAAAFTPPAYLAASGPVAAPVADPWRPAPVPPAGRADYVVSTTGAPGTYSSVQAAVNAAVRAGGTRRLTVQVLPGRYTGAVIVPASAPPLTLRGTRSGEVSLELGVTSTMSPAEYAAAVNPSGQFVAGDPAYALYTSCAGKTTATVGNCAAVLWSAAPGLQLADLTVTDTVLDSPGPVTAQALAVRTDGDRTQLERVRLVSRQDTLFLNTPDAGTIARVSVRGSYVEGDVDYVFGRATAVFEDTEFHSVTSRRPAGNGFVFAPSTAPANRHGFLVARCRLTTDAGYRAAPTAYLGRAWDAGAGTTGYLPGTSPNGQLVIRDSLVGPGHRVADPWAPAATTSRPFSGNVAAGRDLDDPAFNRLWEFRNRVVTG